jgi:hypothetical protein
MTITSKTYNNLNFLAKCMKTLCLVMDTFFYLLKYEFGVLSKFKVAKWSAEGKPDSTVIGPAFRG